jgi:hypothetical protein
MLFCYPPDLLSQIQKAFEAVRLPFTTVICTKGLADSFTRYWFYLLSLGGIPKQLKEIELACKDLFGELEDDPKLQ